MPLWVSARLSSVSARPDSGESEGQAAHSNGKEAAVSEVHATKLVERRQEWRFNRRLAAVSVAVVLLVLFLLTASYLYHSNSAANTFIARADAGRRKGSVGRGNAMAFAVLACSPEGYRQDHTNCRRRRSICRRSGKRRTCLPNQLRETSSCQLPLRSCRTILRNRHG